MILCYVLRPVKKRLFLPILWVSLCFPVEGSVAAQCSFHLLTLCSSRTSVLLPWRQDIGCLQLISFPFPVVSQCPGLCSEVAYLHPLCSAGACFLSHRPLKPEQCLPTGTFDNPAHNGFTSLVRSRTASVVTASYFCLLFPLCHGAVLPLVRCWEQ